MLTYCKPKGPQHASPEERQKMFQLIGTSSWLKPNFDEPIVGMISVI